MIKNPQSSKLIILSGPSGVGKSVIAQALLKKKDLNIKRVITYTDRLPRKKERDGVDYHFISTQEFKRKIKKREFLEWAIVHNKHYGTPKNEIAQIINQGKTPLLVIDVQGVLQIKDKMKKVVLIFVKPKNLEVLKKRIERRKQKMDEDEIKIRLENARKEMAIASIYDYVVTNYEGRFQYTVNQIAKIIKTAQAL